MLAPLPAAELPAPDLERRFGGLQRLYGEAGYARLRAARVAVVGLGGVGSWAVEALARSGVAQLTLIDLDHVAESNINRQVQALGATIGTPAASSRNVQGQKSAAASATSASRSAATTKSARRCTPPFSTTPSKPAWTWEL